MSEGVAGRRNACFTSAEAIVRAAWAAGVRYVDTAPFYGFGQAERCVGDALRNVPRDEWVLSTKVGRLLCPNPSAAEHQQNRMPFDAVFDYSYDAIMRSFEDSLQRLGLGRIDILYVHDIGAMQHGREGHPAIMRTLRGGGYRALEVMEGRLAQEPFFVAGRYSIADIALYAYTHVADEGGFDLERFPAVRAWLRRVQAQPGYVPMPA